MEEWQNRANRARQSYGSTLVISAAMTAAAHPLTYVKVLMQVGHEPLPPQPVTTFFGKKVLRLPNFLQYAGHIKKVDGFLGLYRGLGPRIVHNLMCSTITNSITHKLISEEEQKPSEEEEKSLQSFLKETSQHAVAKSIGVVISYPLHLISIRMMVQFIGRETEYRNIYTSIQEIYKEEGVLGFFSGVVPTLIGEICMLWLCRTMNFVLHKYIFVTEYSEMAEVRNYTQGVSQYIASMVTYPLHLVTNIMAVNDSKLVAGNPPLMPIYSSWTECWVDLGKKGLRSRGSTLFRRTVL